MSAIGPMSVPIPRPEELDQLLRPSYVSMVAASLHGGITFLTATDSPTDEDDVL